MGRPAPAPTGKDLLRHIALFILALFALGTVYRRWGPLAGVVLFLLLAKLGALRLPSVLAALLFGGAGPGSSALGEALRRADVLMHPVTNKSGASGGNDRLLYGFSCMQGWRRTMEDAHSLITSLPLPAQLLAGLADGATPPTHAFFAVFDGHCGSNVANFCAKELPRFVTESNGYKKCKFRDGLVEAFIGIDKFLRSHPGFAEDRSGCTAVSLLVTETHLFCANAGDSRCVLCRDGRVLPLSFDHKPHLPQETRRIMKAGSFVFNRRVNGVLALSRAIGDFGFKQRPGLPWEEQAVTCVPDVQSVAVDRTKDEFAVIACDGIWDVLSNADVVAFVRPKLNAGMPLQAICEQLMDRCLSHEPVGLGCDNMSVIIVNFQQGTAGAASVKDKPTPSASPPSASPTAAGDSPGSPSTSDADSAAKE